MKTYPKGQTIDLGPFQLRDTAGALVDASSTTCAVLKPDGTTQSVTLTHPSIGTYSGKLTVNVAGVWTAEAKLTVGTQTAVLVESFRVNASPLDAATAATTTYATPVMLRQDLDVDPDSLSDMDATRLIEQAEDLIDSLLGGYTPDDTTGRKIVQADVEAWQWSKLQRATILAARQLYANPGMFTDREYTRQKVGDVELEGPLGGPVNGQVLALLDASGLRRLAGRAV